VVGVVRDAKQSALREPPQMQYYVPLGQERSPVSMTSVIQLLVRPRNNATDAIASLRQLVVRDLPDARFVRIAVLQDRIDPLIRPWRIGAELFGLFGVLALIVAGTGLYSVVAYITAQRTHEFGVRIALGARGRHVLRVVMSDSARAVVIGIPIGVAGPLLAARWLNPLLFDESVNDFAVIGAVGILVAIVTLVASAGPARCAMRVDPLMALRVE
jgi:predicted lysophospholipase L1 biosynthesis ABC-type transport system permease subunit